MRPNYAEAHNSRGVGLGKLHRYEEALAAYEQSLALRPDLKNPLHNKACAYSLMGRGASALEWLERAIAADATYRDMARTDQDYAFLRDHSEYGPRFREIVGE